MKRTVIVCRKRGRVKSAANHIFSVNFSDLSDYSIFFFTLNIFAATHYSEGFYILVPRKISEVCPVYWLITVRRYSGGVQEPVWNMMPAHGSDVNLVKGCFIQEDLRLLFPLHERVREKGKNFRKYKRTSKITPKFLNTLGPDPKFFSAFFFFKKPNLSI